LLYQYTAIIGFLFKVLQTLTSERILQPKTLVNENRVIEIKPSLWRNAAPPSGKT
jgi:hypothetical protein